MCLVAAGMVLGINRKAAPGVALTPEQAGAYQLILNVVNFSRLYVNPVH